MARDNRITMPSGIGGLTRYFDEYKSKIEFKPGHVIILIVIIIILEVLLYSFGYSLFGVK